MKLLANGQLFVRCGEQSRNATVLSHCHKKFARRTCGGYWYPRGCHRLKWAVAHVVCAPSFVAKPTLRRPLVLRRRERRMLGRPSRPSEGERSAEMALGACEAPLRALARLDASRCVPRPLRSGRSASRRSTAAFLEPVAPVGVLAALARW